MTEKRNVETYIVPLTAVYAWTKDMKMLRDTLFKTNNDIKLGYGIEYTLPYSGEKIEQWQNLFFWI